MSDVIIKVEGLGKRYIISHEQRESYTALRDVITRKAKKLAAWQKMHTTKEEFWALKDINFEIKQGEAVGIIGRNGAGKSTLLKILSRITEPSTGRIELNGRVASLLEVGTGFHPELTGRENIFLNGAILGMSQAEIKRKFDEIVDFSGVEKFLDTPVKRYSSGMYVRLAFAVAAHLEPEILVVDEVLAVGDAEFQKKCLGKMNEVSQQEGRTVLFVSHNMSAVKQLCSRGILLNNGHLDFDEEADLAIINYQKLFASQSSEMDYNAGMFENENIKVVQFSVSPIAKRMIDIETDVFVELGFINKTPNINLDVTFELRTSEEIIVYHTGAIITKNKDSFRGEYKVSYVIPKNTLNSGNYFFNLIFGEDQRYVLFKVDRAIVFDIENVALGSNSSRLPGVIRPNFQYKIEKNQ